MALLPTIVESANTKMKKKYSRPLLDYFVISMDLAVYKVFKFIVVVSCIVSSFLYAFYGAFRLDVDFDSPDEFKDVDPVLDINKMNYLQNAFEGLFLLDTIMKFFLEYTDDYTNNKIRDLSMISVRYLKNGFLFDFLPLIPWNWLFAFRYSRLLYLIKVLRLL
jgi:hypothetical protein